MAGASLVSTQSHVETPFIVVKIGNYTFGHCGRSDRLKLQNTFNITYPNYMEALNITKLNGAVNTYTLSMVYAITANDDPNKLEKVFSSVSNTRTLKLSYGDWSAPQFIYKEEEAIITKISTQVNMRNSTIQYTITCTSTSLKLSSTPFSFPAKFAKPSDEIKALFSNNRYGLFDIFKGVTSTNIEELIASDDKAVQLEAKPSVNVLDYISYLVSCMVSFKDSSDSIKTACYYWSVYDDISNVYGGSYIRVVKVNSNTNIADSYNTYEVDIGYPTDACVMDFSINSDDSWALMYNYSKQIHTSEYVYRIDDDGAVVPIQSEAITNSPTTHNTTEATRDWWSRVTQFPITATLTLKGLLRPTMLMSYVKVNTYFYGRKHISSGLYIITKQQDTINSSGYRTTLSLTRVGGDAEYI